MGLIHLQTGFYFSAYFAKHEPVTILCHIINTLRVRPCH